MSVCDDLDKQIKEAAKELRYDDVLALSAQYVRDCLEGSRPDDVPTADAVKKLLLALRRKRFFEPLEKIAKASLPCFDGTEDGYGIVVTQYAQALIDMEKLAAAEGALKALKKRWSADTKVGSEARGLLGRLYKQTWIDTVEEFRDPDKLADAVDAYYDVYGDPALKESNWWHGINVVACLARAERESILDAVNRHGIDWRAEAEAIYRIVSEWPRDHDGNYDTWAAATALEACVARGDAAGAMTWCAHYVTSEYADVFELTSTERQLREVWQLDRRDDPGSRAMQIVKAMLVDKGGALTLPAAPVPTADSISLNQIPQARLGNVGAQPVTWLLNLYKQCRSIAKITNLAGDGRGGTGFLVSSANVVINNRHIHVEPERNFWLFTNNHVLNSTGADGAIRFKDAVIHFTLLDGADARIELGALLKSHPAKAHIVAESPLKEMDVSVIGIDLPDTLTGRYSDLGLVLTEHDDVHHTADGAAPRLFVIGHPGGGDMQISLYDNKFMELRSPRIHYRSPTEGGSSGSPVLSSSLRVVAVHHATYPETPPSNAGILIDAIAREHLTARETHT